MASNNMLRSPHTQGITSAQNFQEEPPKPPGEIAVLCETLTKLANLVHDRLVDLDKQYAAVQRKNTVQCDNQKDTCPPPPLSPLGNVLQEHINALIAIDRLIQKMKDDCCL